MGRVTERHLRTVDPGQNTGLAYFEDRILVFAGVVPGGDVQFRNYDGALAIEMPRVYPGGRGKGDPNQIVDLAYQAGRIAGTFHGEAIRVFPHTWKAQVDGDIMCERILGYLEARETALLEGIPKGVRHNAVDAIGIGLFVLGRMGRGGVRP